MKFLAAWTLVAFGLAVVWALFGELERAVQQRFHDERLALEVDRIAEQMRRRSDAA